MNKETIKPASSPLQDVEHEAARILNTAQAQGITLRLLGGLAVRLHSPSAALPGLARVYPDLDFATTGNQHHKLTGLFTSLGYIPNVSFNALNGGRRLLFFDEENERKVDIFIDTFEMCHKIPLARRLNADPISLPLAELFLTKAQIVDVNRKDLLDMLALLLDHPTGDNDQETINLAALTSLCADDWGLYTTLQLTCNKIIVFMDENSPGLETTTIQIIKHRLGEINAAIENTPKTIRWKIRSRAGTRLRWYNEVEEINR